MSDIKAAAEEIKAILKKHNLAALITLQGPDTLEFVRVIDPTWSCARIEKFEDGYGIRIRAKLEEYPSKEAQKEAVEQTIGMIFGFRAQAEADMQSMEGVASMILQTFPEIAFEMTRKA